MSVRYIGNILRMLFIGFFAGCGLLYLAFSIYIHTAATDIENKVYLITTSSEHLTKATPEVVQKIYLTIAHLRISLVFLLFSFIGMLIIFTIIFHKNILKVFDREEKANFMVKLASRVFDSSKEALMIVDHSSKVIMVNKSYEKITGHSTDKVVGQYIKDVTCLGNVRNFDEIWSICKQNKSWVGEIVSYSKDGHPYSKHLSIDPIFDDNGIEDKNKFTRYSQSLVSPGKNVNHIIKFFDIGDRRRLESESLYYLRHDDLTSLPNRKFLSQMLDHTILDSKDSKNSFSVLFIGIDRFKNINDTYGHHVGDEILQQIANRMKSAIRSTDFVSRYGGDDFVIVLRCVDPSCISQVIDKIASDITDKVYYSLQIKDTFAITFSIGVSFYPSDGKSEDSLISKANTAMRVAKKEGRNQVVLYNDSMDSDTTKIETNILKSIRIHNTLGFFLVYQPQVDIKSHQIVGCEALLRWRSEEGELVSPLKFIPILEENNLITSIGEWVLSTACNDFKKIVQQNSRMTGLTISVNISPKQLEKPNFHLHLVDILRQIDFDFSRLELEVTESSFMKHFSDINQKLFSLTSEGVKVSIDDFGSGYSSLSRLIYLPITKLKLDGLFMKDFSTNVNSKQIIRSVVQIGKALNLKILAEGVETLEQLEYLETIGCDEVQGYYFAKPMLLDDLLTFSLAPRMKSHSVV